MRMGYGALSVPSPSGLFGKLGLRTLIDQLTAVLKQREATGNNLGAQFGSRYALKKTLITP